MEVHGRQLRRRRYELGLTLAQVATRAQVDVSNLSKLERGILTGAHIGTVSKLARVLDLPLDQFVPELATPEAKQK